MRLPSAIVALGLGLSSFGCSDESIVVPAQEPRPAPATTTTIYIRAARDELPPVSLEPRPVVSTDHVKVYPDKDVGRMTEVVGVLDFHTDASTADKGFEQLKARAAALGADAVIGAEFEHGDPGEKSHLSGMAVRFIDR